MLKTRTRHPWIALLVTGMLAMRGVAEESSRVAIIDPFVKALESLGAAAPESERPSRSSRTVTGMEPDGAESAEEAKIREELNRIRTTVISADDHARLGNLRTAVDMLEQALERASVPRGRFVIHGYLARFETAAGHPGTARGHLREAMAIERHAAIPVAIGALYIQEGRAEEGLAMLEEAGAEMLVDRATLFNIHFNRACAHCLLNRTTEALDDLNRAALVDRFKTLAMLGDPQLDPARNDPRYQTLLKLLEP